MFDSLKRIAMQKLVEKMASNALSSDATSAAAEEGAGAVMETIKSKLAGGGIEDVKALFSGGADMESNDIFQNAKAKLSEVLQSKGMNAEEAEAEAANTAPELINSLKEKFLSQDEADSEFNLDSITNLIPGNAGDLLNKAKSLF